MSGPNQTGKYASGASSTGGFAAFSVRKGAKKSLVLRWTEKRRKKNQLTSAKKKGRSSEVVDIRSTNCGGDPQPLPESMRLGQGGGNYVLKGIGGETHQNAQGQF